MYHDNLTVEGASLFRELYRPHTFPIKLRFELHGLSFPVFCEDLKGSLLGPDCLYKRFFIEAVILTFTITFTIYTQDRRACRICIRVVRPMFSRLQQMPAQKIVIEDRRNAYRPICVANSYNYIVGRNLPRHRNCGRCNSLPSTGPIRCISACNMSILAFCFLSFVLTWKSCLIALRNVSDEAMSLK